MEDLRKRAWGETEGEGWELQWRRGKRYQGSCNQEEKDKINC